MPGTALVRLTHVDQLGAVGDHPCHLLRRAVDFVVFEDVLHGVDSTLGGYGGGMEPVATRLDLSAARRVPWQVSVDVVAELADALAADFDTVTLVGDRFGMGSDEPSPTVVIADRPAQSVEQAHKAKAHGADVVVTFDWPVPGWQVDAVHELSHWHRAFVHRPRVAKVSLDERHMLAIVHPHYDGFLVVRATAHAAIADLRLVPDSELAPRIEAHSASGPLRPGQERPFDLELMSPRIPPGGVTGTMALFDGGKSLGIGFKLTLATSTRAVCSIAGVDDGPVPPDSFNELVQQLLTGEQSARKIARTIDRAEAGDDAGDTGGGGSGGPFARLRRRLRPGGGAGSE